jgi:hypothetical protein
MSATPTNDPVARLERLEREAADLKERLKRTTSAVSLLQWMIVIVVAAAVGVPTYYVQTGKVRPQILLEKSVSTSLDAQEIGLHNRDGKRVMFADYDKFGQPYVLFFDGGLALKMGLYINNGRPEVNLYDNKGTRASLHVAQDGQARLELIGQKDPSGLKNKGGVVLSTAQDGTPRLRMTDASGKVLFEAPPAPGSGAPNPGP